MIRAEPHSPTDTETLRSLVIEPRDLQLMMPKAELPFNPTQWQRRLSEPNTLSYTVHLNQNIIGFFALLRIEGREATLGFVYLHPKWRGSGLGRELVQLSERTAIQKP